MNKIKNPRLGGTGELGAGTEHVKSTQSLATSQDTNAGGFVMTEPTAPFTVFTSTGGELAKTFGFKEGKVTKEAPGTLASGTYEIVTKSLPELKKSFLNADGHKWCICTGTPSKHKGRITTKTRHNKEGQPADPIPRAKEYFKFREQQTLCLTDIDGIDKPIQTILADLEKVIPGFVDAGRLVVFSSSAGLMHGGQLVKDSTSCHLYLIVKDETDIPRFMEVLFDRLWLAGHGHITISASGAMLTRTIIDKTVAAPERIIYEAPPILKDGLTQKRPEPELKEGVALDTKLLLDLNEDEREKLEAMINDAKAAKAPDAEQTTKAYTSNQAAKIAKGQGITLNEAETVVKSRLKRVLADEDVLYFAEKPDGITVKEVLESGQEWNGKSLADPLEPDYDGGSLTKAKFYWNDGKKKPLIQSFAHGVQKYSFKRYAVKAAADWPEPTPLPATGGAATTGQEYKLELLPESIREAATEVARFVQVPAVSPAVVGLACCAVAIGKKAVVVEKPGLQHHPSMFQVLLAGSGERKSPVFTNMTYPLNQWTRDQKEIFEDRQREAKVKNMAIDAAVAGLKRQAGKNDADLDSITHEMAETEARRLKAPPFPLLFSTDITEQRLFQKMHDRGGAFAVMSGEGRPVFDAILGKYSGESGMTGDGIYLAGISGDTITRDRIGGENGVEERFIHTPCLNVCVMVQPDKYMTVANHSSLRNSGALARIWPVWLPSLVGSRFEVAGDEGLNFERMADYSNLIETLLQSEPPINEQTGDACHEARLSDGAADVRREFHNAVEKLMAKGKEFEDVRDIASKATTQVTKFALIMHLADDPFLLKEPDSLISPETWGRAQAIGWFHLEEAVRIQRMAVDYGKNDLARRFLDWIKREGLQKVTVRGISQSGPRPRLKAAQARKVLDILVDHGYLKSNEPPGDTRQNYFTNPCLVSSTL